MRAVSLLKIAAVFITAFTLTAGATLAFEEKPFDMAAFKAAQSDGKPIIVDAYAAWCPVCRAQQKVLGELKQNPKYDALTLFRLDYDSQADALRDLKIQKQSTLVAFKGAKETGRSIGATKTSAIEDLIKSALN
jgi:thioredoxin-like negative regulator of GroEL